MSPVYTAPCPWFVHSTSKTTNPLSNYGFRALCVCPIDPDSHPDWLNHFFFAYFFPSLSDFLLVCGGLSVFRCRWRYITKHDVAEAYASYNRYLRLSMSHAYPTSLVQGQRIVARCLGLARYIGASMSTSSQIHKREEGELRYVINRLVQKLFIDREHRH
jgi:hypothetical protein